MKTSLTFILLLSTLFIFSQKKKKDNFGYIITLQGETVSGRIKKLKPYGYGPKYFTSIKFYKTSNSEPVKYKACEINSCFVDSTLFEGINTNTDYNKCYFLEKAIEGKITLYFKHIANRATVVSGGAPINVGSSKWIRSAYYLKLKDSEKLINLGYGSKFRKTAVIFFKDNPALVEKIKNKELKAKNIYDIIEIYNKD